MRRLGLLFLLSLYLQIVQHQTALAAGVALLPLFSPLAVLAPLPPPRDRMGAPHPGEVLPEVNRRWTDSNSAHGERGLKHRAADETRRVPIPPELVAILRAHIDTFGVAPDGRIFSSDRGHPAAASSGAGELGPEVSAGDGDADAARGDGASARGRQMSPRNVVGK